MSAYVEGDWLERHLGDPDVRIIESSIAKATYYGAHIPGAAWVDFHADLLVNGDDSAGHVINSEQFAALMSRLGITAGSKVVWYGDRHSSYAIRGFWMMDYYQHPGGSLVLEGGRERWLAESRPMTSEITHVVPSSYPEQCALTNAHRADWKEVRAAIGAPDRAILDVRSQEEFEGVSVRAGRGGHIPGAVHIEWTDATSGDNVLKSEQELRRLYESRVVTPDKEIITYCQLGIRAAHTWFVLKHVLGYPNVKNYDGSWREWGDREDLPIER